MKTLKAIAANLRDGHERAAEDLARGIYFGWSALLRTAERVGLTPALARLGSAAAAAFVRADAAAAGWVRPHADGDSVPVRLSFGEQVTDPDRLEALGLTADARRIRGDR